MGPRAHCTQRMGSPRWGNHTSPKPGKQASKPVSYIPCHLVKSLKFPNDNFDITNHITFASNSTRSASFRKLVHSKTSNTTQHHFYFNRISRLYNYLPVINLSLSTNIIKRQISDYLWTQFSINFDSERPCTFHILCPCYRCSSLPVSSNFNQL